MSLDRRSDLVAIADRSVGRGYPCLIVAEVAQNHDGSLGAAHAYIDAVAKTGADAIKFQTHIAAAESTVDEPWRVEFSRQDRSRYEYWRRMEFSEEQWHGLATHARDNSLIFLATPFSFEAADLLDRVGVPAWKVSSGDVANTPLLERVSRTQRPVILSSGMSGWDDIERAVQTVRANGAPPVVLQCTTAYPCPPERLGLNLIAECARRFECPAGLSDHSGTIFAGLAAVALGASVVEVHVTLSRECFGPDVSSSITTQELSELVRGIRFIETALARPLDKDEVAATLEDMRSTFGKSVVAARQLPAGRLLTLDDVTVKKPGTGIPAARFNEVLGRRLQRAVEHDSALCEEDLE